MLLPQGTCKDNKRDEEEGGNDVEQEEEEEEEEEKEPSSNLHLICDDIEMNDIDDDVMEEACIDNDNNLWSTGALKYNDSSSTSKTIAKKTPDRTTSPEKDKEKSLPNKIMVTNLNDSNAPIMFSNSIFEVFYFETFFGELNAKLSPNTNHTCNLNSFTCHKLLSLFVH